MTRLLCGANPVASGFCVRHSGEPIGGREGPIDRHAPRSGSILAADARPSDEFKSRDIQEFVRFDAPSSVPRVVKEELS
jgi:hypothetical protein